MRAGDIAEIRDLELFSGMSESCFDELIRGAYVQNFPPLVELITEGDTADFLHVVLNGSVELYAGWNGRETSMATVRPVSLFILAATIRDGPYLMSARTAEKSQIVLLPSVDVRTAFEQDHDFALAVMQELAMCYRSVIKDTKNLKLRTSIERLANYLIRNHTRAGGTGEFDLRLEKRRLASFLGMTPENLSRTIRALRPYGVRIDGARVCITSPQRLQTLANTSPLIDDYST